MEPIADKPPTQIQQYDRRPESVDGLFSATMIGIKDLLPKSVASSTPADPSQSWDSIYSQTKQTLRSEQQSASSPVDQARLALFQNQLKTIDEANPAERTKILQGLKINDNSMQQLEGNLTDVKRMLGTAQFSSAIQKQKESVDIVDRLNQKGLSVELSSIRESISGSSRPEVRARLSHDLESTINVMGAPFTERVRLASLQLRSNQEYQAEKTLDSALKVNTPAEVWSIPTMAHLREDAQRTRDGLYVKHNLVPLFERFGTRFATASGREDCKLDEIKRAPGNEREFVALKQFLTNNYDKLTKNHPFYKFSYGITRGDLENYSKQEASKVNDIVN